MQGKEKTESLIFILSLEEEQKGEAKKCFGSQVSAMQDTGTEQYQGVWWKSNRYKSADINILRG